MKSKKNKTALIVLSIILVTVVVIIFVSVMGGKEIGNVVFTDSKGEKIATVKYDGEKELINAVEEGYCDYVKIALEEAIELYKENNESVSDNPTEDFFKNIVRVDTNFHVSYYEKIEEALSVSELEEDTPFASVIVDPKGRVLASYSFISEKGKTYSLYKTYAGSSIKPLSVYTPAIESGTVHWSSRIKDAPIKKIASESEGVREWPMNASGTYTGENMLVCDALYKSINTVAVRVLKRMGVDYSVSFLSEKLGLNLDAEKRILKAEDDDEIYGNIALGYLVDGVSPLEMAGYYQIFINDGKYTEPYAVVSFEDGEGKVTNNKPDTERVISSATASIMAKLMEGVVSTGGTGKEANVPGVSIAGKSGTSDNYYDNWFIGFTSKIVCSVWHGYNDQSKNSAPAIFGSIVKQFSEDITKRSVAKNVITSIYCNRSGGLKGKKCYDTSIGYYLKGSMPSVCTECGK